MGSAGCQSISVHPLGDLLKQFKAVGTKRHAVASTTTKGHGILSSEDWDCCNQAGRKLTIDLGCVQKRYNTT